MGDDRRLNDDHRGGGRSGVVGGVSDRGDDMIIIPSSLRDGVLSSGDGAIDPLLLDGAAGRSSVPLNDREGDDDNSISDLNELVENLPSEDLNDTRNDDDDEDDPYGDAGGAVPSPRARQNRRGSASSRGGGRHRGGGGGGRERRRSSAVALEKHDSLILSELASLMDEMDDEDLESALSESVASMGMGGLGLDVDADADEDAAIAAAAEGAAATVLGDEDYGAGGGGAGGMIHRLGERRHSAFGSAQNRRDSNASDAAAPAPPRRTPQRRASLSSAPARTGRRGSAARRSLHESLGNVLLHRDYRSANLTVSRSDNRRPSYSRRGSGYSSGYGRRRSSGLSRGSIEEDYEEDEEDDHEAEAGAGGVGFHQSTGMLVDGSRSLRRLSLASHREEVPRSETLDEVDEVEAFDEGDYSDWDVQPVTATGGRTTASTNHRPAGDAATPRGGGILRRSSVRSAHSSSSHHSHSHYIVDPSGGESTVTVQVALRRSSQVSFLGNGDHSDDEDDEDEDGPFNSRGEGNMGRRGYGAAA